MSSHLGVGKILDLLERLRRTVRELTARADKLNADFSARTGREQRLREAVEEKQAAELAAAVSEAEAAFATASEAALAKYEARKTWIGKAYQASKEQALTNVETRTGTRKYELQKKMLQAERDRSAGLAATAAALEEFKANAAAEQTRLASMEATASGLFKGYWKLRRGFSAAYQKAIAPEAAKDANQLLAELREVLGKTSGDLGHFRRFPLLRVFKYLPLWALICLCAAPLVLHQYGLNSAAYEKAGVCVLVGLMVVLILRYLAVRQAGPLAGIVSNALARARVLHDVGVERADSHYHQELERIQEEFENTTRTADQQLKQAIAQAGESRVACRMASDEKASRALEKNQRQRQARLDRLKRQHAGDVEQLKLAAEARSKAEIEASQKREAQFDADYQAQWQAIEAEWKSTIGPVYQDLESASAKAGALPTVGAAHPAELARAR